MRCLFFVISSHPFMLDYMYFPVPPKNHIYIGIGFSSISSEQFLRAIWDAVSQTIALILPKIKLSSQLSHAFFKKLTECSMYQQ